MATTAPPKPHTMRAAAFAGACSVRWARAAQHGCLRRARRDRFAWTNSTGSSSNHIQLTDPGRCEIESERLDLTAVNSFDGAIPRACTFYQLDQKNTRHLWLYVAVVALLAVRASQIKDPGKSNV